MRKSAANHSADFKSYAYQPLSNVSSFRAFVLGQGGKSDPIHGVFTEFDLDDSSRDYCALSYTSHSVSLPNKSLQRGNLDVGGESDVDTSNLFSWHGQPLEYDVLIEEMAKLRVTRNLYSALVRLRSETHVIPLFVDALSIDQGMSARSLSERAQQIRLMGKVFGNAKAVFIDLGDYSDGAADCIMLVNCFANVEVDLWNAPKEDRRGYDAVLPPEVSRSLTQDTWKSFIALCSRPWWRRLWVLQEVLLAREGLFYVNHHTVPIHKMLTGLTRIWDYANSTDVLTTALGRDRQLRSEIFTTCRHACVSMSNLLGHIRLSPTSSEHGMALIQILALTDRFETTIPHDQIFALLGLAQEHDRSKLNVDYTSHYKDVLLSFSQHVLRSGNVNLLLHLLPWRKSASLPSWVLDPRSKSANDTLDSSIFYEETAKAYQAGERESPALSSFEAGGSLLGLRCIKIGTIAVLSSTYPSFLTESSSPYWSLVGSWCEDAKQMYITNQIDHSSAPMPSSKVVWTTLTAGRRLRLAGFGSVVDSLDTCIAAFDKWLCDNKPAGFVNAHYGFTSDVIRCYNYITTICENRRFGITADERPCLVPTTAECGDEVVLLTGVDIPFVVRRRSSAAGCNDRRQEMYVLIGSAYAHGVMDRELLNEGSKHVEEDIWLM